MDQCPNDDELQLFLAEQLLKKELREIDEHLKRCGYCREYVDHRLKDKQNQYQPELA